MIPLTNEQQEELLTYTTLTRYLCHKTLGPYNILAEDAQQFCLLKLAEAISKKGSISREGLASCIITRNICNFLDEEAWVVHLPRPYLRQKHKGNPVSRGKYNTKCGVNLISLSRDNTYNLHKLEGLYVSSRYGSKIEYEIHPWQEVEDLTPIETEVIKKYA